MSSDPSKPTMEGQRLVERWLEAQGEVTSAKSRLNAAECEVRNAENALAKWLLPDDAQTGEKIAVWCGDSLIQVQKLDTNDAKVTVRTRGRHL